jgi:hypothetical protein
MTINVRTATTISTYNSYGNRSLRINHFGTFGYQGTILWFFFKPKLEIGEIIEDEAPIQSGTLRKYLRLVIYNRGRAKAENCYGILTLIKHNSTSKLQPSSGDKYVLWDTDENYRFIGAKKGKAILNIVFSQDSFIKPQTDPIKGNLSEEDKIYTKISTLYSLNHLDPTINLVAEDGIGIGDTYFKLSVNPITGESVEAVFKVHVSNNWHELSMEKVS